MALTVGDVMSTQIISVSPEAPVGDATGLLATYGISGLPVVDDIGNVVGLVSEFDIIGKSGSTVRQIMTRNVISVSPQTPLDEAARILTDLRIRRLPVMEDGRLAGIISRSDIVRRIATRWTCSVCGSYERGAQPPERCPMCGATTREFVLEREPAGM